MRIERRHGRLLSLLLIGGVLSCGEPLVDGDYRGEPLLVLTGRVVEMIPQQSGEPLPSQVDDVRVALFWAQSPDGPSQSLEAVSSVEQQVQAESMILRYEVRVHTPPPESALALPYLGQGQVALGQLIAYLDSNGSGAWEPEMDQLVGGVRDRAVVYTPDGASGQMFDAPLSAGFHLMGSAPCVDSENVMRLAPAPDDEPQLEVNLDIESWSFLDLNCDGKTWEWFHAHCQDPDELEWLCSQPDLAPLDQERCNHCGEFVAFDVCEDRIPACEEQQTPLPLCEAYQLCLDSDWAEDPIVVCDTEYVACYEAQPEGSDCDQLYETCTVAAECALGQDFCLNEQGFSPEECEAMYDMCLAGDRF